jgi:hypothetical protein
VILWRVVMDDLDIEGSSKARFEKVGALVESRVDSRSRFWSSISFFRCEASIASSDVLGSLAVGLAVADAEDEGGFADCQS